MITFTCSKCSRKYNVRDDLAGKRSKCAGCGTVLTIPAATAVGITTPRPAAPTPGKAAAKAPVVERPVRKSPVLLFAGGGIVVVAVGIVLAVLLVMKSDSPSVVQGRPNDTAGMIVSPKSQATPAATESGKEKSVATDEPKTDRPKTVQPNPDQPKTDQPKPPDEPKAPSGEPKPNANGKLPVPDAAKLAEAQRRLRKNYDPLDGENERVLFAKECHEKAMKAKPGSVEQYALLREAHDQSARGGYMDLALQARDQAELRFEIDKLDWTTTALENYAKAESRRGQFGWEALLDRLLAQATEQTDQYRYPEAAKILALAEKYAQQWEPAMRPKVDDRRNELDRIQKGYAPVEAAKQTLATDPEDPAANLAWAKFLVVVLGKWDRALTHLARAGDPALKSAVEKELANPREAAGQTELADAWRTLGLAEKGPMQAVLLARARHWYAQAKPMLEGDAQAKVEKQISDLDARLSGATSLRYGRAPKVKEVLLATQGGNAQSEAAVEAGLKWIARHQALDGHWSMDKFHMDGKCNCGNPGGTHDVGGTAFGLLPLLGAGYTHKPTEQNVYAKQVERGLKWLMTRQAADGAFSGSGYEHSLATIAMCEAYGMTGDPMLKKSAQRAIDCCVAWQHAGGGFRYAPRQPGDLSVTSWFVQALKSGQIAGLNVPDNTWKGINNYLGSVGTPDGWGYGYQQPQPAPTMTAAGLLDRQYLGADPKSDGALKGITYLQKLPPSPNFRNLYFNYYATQVMFHHASAQPDAWKAWNLKMRDILIQQQDKGTDAQHKDQLGSWSPEGDAWGGQMGRLGHTSMSILLLEVYYRNLPLYRRDLGPIPGDAMPEEKK